MTTADTGAQGAADGGGLSGAAAELFGQAHAILDEMGIERAEGKTCDDPDCNSMLIHRLKELQSELPALVAEVARLRAALEQVERTLSNFVAPGAAQDELDGLILAVYETLTGADGEAVSE